MHKRHYLILVLHLIGCRAKYAGFIPMYQDEFIGTTNERSFELTESLTGYIIRFQPSYDCKNDSIINNSTSIIRLDNGDTVTVYSPCQLDSFEIGSLVTVEPASLHDRSIQQTKRVVIKQFPKKHQNYPYWECISCKYPNTIGKVVAQEKG